MKDQTPTPVTNTKKAPYIAPKIVVTEIRIEQGFQLSTPHSHHGMTEGITDYHYQEIGNPDPYYPDGSPMTEGITNGETRFF